MGRHSAPDEVEEDSAVTEATSTVPGTASAVDVEALRGRHARSDDEQPDGSGFDEGHTQRIGVIEAPPMIADPPTDVFVPWAAPAEAPPVQPAAPEAEPAVEPAVEPGKKPKKSKQKAPKQPKQAKPDRAQAKAAKAERKRAEAQSKAQSKAQAKAAAKAESNTRADLRVLRENPAVRAQAIAAVVVSFLLYTVVMLAIGRTGAYLMWLWAPIVISGVLVGVVLDLAHRRLSKRAGKSG